MRRLGSGAPFVRQTGMRSPNPRLTPSTTAHADRSPSPDLLATHTSRYAMGDAVVTHVGGDVRRPVTVFGGVIASTNDYVPFKSQTIAGPIVTGPLAGRPNETLGIVGSYMRLGSHQIDFLQASRANVVGIDRVRNGEAV
ncbi:hypothetical protein D0Z70_15810 [Sphingobium terrigena]|uniref:Uncharacterized protein n=1 Tax=Sphingobium terrigena TaxID=2304063 RepID=A0A418YPY5_9SPHN|nr:hypothetical protein D0Z70_15810 [Sphingobium terrigena]